MDKTDRLRELHDLKIRGILSDDEFDIEKNKILNESDSPPVMVPPPPGMMQGGPPLPPPPQQGSSGSNVVAIIAVVLVVIVVIGIILSAVLYVWASSFLEQGESAPIATFWVEESSNGIYYAEVIRVSKEEDLISFSFFLKDAEGSTYGGGNGFGEIAMQKINSELYGIDVNYNGNDDELQQRSDNVNDDDGTDYPVHFSDNDGDFKFSEGDWFAIYGQGNSANGPAQDGWKLDIQFDPTGDIIGSAQF